MSLYSLLNISPPSTTDSIEITTTNKSATPSLAAAVPSSSQRKRNIEDEIQKSYKHLSRIFHPDKQQQQQQQQQQNNHFHLEKENDTFLQIKNAYDVLMDPVLRFAYDEFGYDGVIFVKQSLMVSNHDNNNDDDENEEEDVVNGENSEEEEEDGDEEKESDDDAYGEGQDKRKESQPQFHPKPKSKQKQKAKIMTLYDELYDVLVTCQNPTRAQSLLLQEMQFQRYQQYQTMKHVYFMDDDEKDEFGDVASRDSFRSSSFSTQNQSNSTRRQDPRQPIVRQGWMEIQCTAIPFTEFLFRDGDLYATQTNTPKADFMSHRKQMIPFQRQQHHQQQQKKLDLVNPWMEVERSKMAFQFTFPFVTIHDSDPKTNMNTETNKARIKNHSHLWNWSIGGENQIKGGIGQCSTTLGLGYTPVQGTDVHWDCTTIVEDGKQQVKFSMDSSRAMINGTYITTNISTIPATNHFAFSIFSHRSLFHHSFHGTWGMGMSSNLDFHFVMLSFTSLFHTQKQRVSFLWPKVTLKLNIGADLYPFRLIVQHDFHKISSHHDHSSQGHTRRLTNFHRGEVSLGISTTMGIDAQCMSTRAISKFCKISIGAQHTTQRGLTWIFRLHRGDMTLSVPIFMTLRMSPSYIFKTVYIGLWTTLLDMVIGDWLHETRTMEKRKNSLDANLLDDRHDCDSLLFISSITSSRWDDEKGQIFHWSKSRQEAQQQQRWMEAAAVKKRIMEEANVNGGLVILNATYAAKDGDNLDVTTVLQSWVVDSSLHLAKGSKSTLLGFYNVSSHNVLTLRRRRHGTRNVVKGWWPNIKNYLQLKFPTTKEETQTQLSSANVPMLTVRYQTGSGTFEITVMDEEELMVPSPMALRLGGGNVK